MGIEPACRVLSDLGWHIAPSTFYAHLSRSPSARALEDERLKKQIVVIREENYDVYGVRKVWVELGRRGESVGRDQVGRLMAEMGIVGVVRGPTVRTTIRDDTAERAADLVKRQFVAGAPDRLWVTDFTYVRVTTIDFVYVAFVIDVFSRKIVSWEASPTKEATFVLNAISRAVSNRRYRHVPGEFKLVHHSDAGSQYTSLKYTQHLADSGIEPSIGTVGDALDNALAESTIGLYKTELIKPRGPWYGLEDVELATGAWVDWYNNQRLHSACRYRPPVEFESLYHSGDLTSLLHRPT